MISLIGRGVADLHVGLYNMSQEDAVQSFLETAKKYDLTAPKVHVKADGVYVKFKDLEEDLSALLDEIADVADLRGDPPSIYIFRPVNVPENGYAKTGQWAD